MELLLLSNSTVSGGGFLQHALGPIAELLPRRTRLAFFAQASTDPARYTAVMREALQPLRISVVPTHGDADAAAELERADAVFVGGGNSFRLLCAFETLDLLEPMRDFARRGRPYLSASAGTNLACPSIRTTNDMPIVQPRSLAALGLVPFQINPHYVEPSPGSSYAGESRDERLAEFLDENDVPVLALREGSWLRVHDGYAVLGGAGGGRLFVRGSPPAQLVRGSDLSALLETTPRYDTPEPSGGARDVVL